MKQAFRVISMKHRLPTMTYRKYKQRESANALFQRILYAVLKTPNSGGPSGVEKQRSAGRETGLTKEEELLLIEQAQPMKKADLIDATEHLISTFSESRRAKLHFTDGILGRGLVRGFRSHFSDKPLSLGWVQTTRVAVSCVQRRSACVTYFNIRKDYEGSQHQPFASF